MGTEKTEPLATEMISQSEPKASASPAAKTAEADNLGLALSGGGVRATLFSLGVVLGLVEMQCHGRVRCVASVSGGSILNAALAHGKPLSSFSIIKDFEPLASKLAAKLASQGVFALDWRNLTLTVRYFVRYLWLEIIPIMLALLVSVAGMPNQSQDKLGYRLLHQFFGGAWDLVGSHLWLLGGLAIICFFAVVWFNRGIRQEALYQSVLSTIASSKRDLFVKDLGAPSDESELRVMHVLVATDLLSGQPFYFSGQFVHCMPYGWCRPEKLRTAEAIYSSAAFPAVFPPKKLKLNRLNFQSGEMAGELPDFVKLVDGGVYNNLGTNWFDVLAQQSESPDLLWPFGGLKVDALKIKQENVIVVNASAPSRSVQKLSVFTTLARIMSVLYDNTVRPRLDSLNAEHRPIIDIKESPIQLAERLRKEGADDERVETATRRLRGWADEFWADFARDTAGTETKLSKAGPRTTARLMLHGYLSSLVLLYITFGADLPQVIRDEGYFHRLVRRSGEAGSADAVSDVERL